MGALSQHLMLHIKISHKTFSPTDVAFGAVFKDVEGVTELAWCG